MLGPCPLRVGAWLTPKQAPPYVFPHGIFGSDASKGVQIKGNPKNWGALGPTPWADWSMANPLKTSPLPTCYRTKLGCSRSNSTSVIQIYLKNVTLTSWLSKSLKVIGTNMNQSTTYDFPLMFRSNHGSISYCFRDKWRFQSKIANFLHTCVFNASTKWVPLGFGNTRRPQETRMMGYQAEKKV